MKLIKSGRVHIGNGKVLENTDILIDKDKIIRIDKDIENDCEVIDAKGKDIFPGFIDPISQYGCIDTTFSIKDTDELSDPITPEANIVYSFNDEEIMDERLFEVGITTIGAAPGNKNILGGQMAVFSTCGTNSLKMKLKDKVSVKGSASIVVKDTYGSKQRFPMTRMGVFTKLEELFETSKRNIEKEEKDEKQKVIEKILNKEMPLFMHVKTEAEINAIMHIAKKYDIKLIICGAYEAHKCLKQIKNQNIGVIIGEQNFLNVKAYRGTDLNKISSIMDNGNLMSFSISTDYGVEGKVVYLWNAMAFYKEGVEAERVVEMMTLNPAKMLGMEDSIGSIEVQKRADLVIYEGHPITHYSAKTFMTIIGGEIVYKRGEQNASN